MKKHILTLIVLVMLTGCQTATQNTPKTLQYESPTVQPKTATLLRLGDNMLESGDVTSALGFYQKAHETQPNIALPLMKQSNTFFEAGQMKAGAEKLFEATKAEPRNQEIAVQYARLLLNENPAKASNFLIDAASRFNNARFYNWLGVSFDMVGRHKDAQIAYQNALALDVRNTSTMNNLGLSYAVTGMGDQAVATFKRLTDLEPKNVLYKKNMAIAQTLAKDIEGARKTLANVIPSAEAEALINTYRSLPKDGTPLDLLRKINQI